MAKRVAKLVGLIKDKYGIDALLINDGPYTGRNSIYFQYNGERVDIMSGDNCIWLNYKHMTWTCKSVNHVMLMLEIGVKLRNIKQIRKDKLKKLNDIKN